MTQWNRLGLAAGLALALVGTARAQGATGTGSGTTETTPGGAAAAGSSETSTTPSTAGSDTSSTTGGGHRAVGATEPGDAAAGGAMHGTAGARMHGTAGKVDPKLEQGLQKLHAANQAEVQMGQMAAQTAQDEQVKAFAQKMVDDHQKNDQQLEQLAQQVGVTLTGPAFDAAQKDAEKDMAKFHAKSGQSFDRSYMSHMVKDHQKDVKEVGSLAKKAHQAKQAELASFLDETHVAMQGHLQEAKQVEKATRSAQRQGRRGAAGSAPSRSGTDTGAPGSAGSGDRYVPPPTERGHGSGTEGSGTPAPGHRP